MRMPQTSILAMAALASVVLAVAGCENEPAAPPGPAVRQGQRLAAEVQRPGNAFVLSTLTGAGLAIVGTVDKLVIDQAVVNHVVLVNSVDGVHSFTITGTVSGVIEATGAPIVHEQFTSTLTLAAGARGCQSATFDLGPLNIDALGLVTEDVPTATLSELGAGPAVGLLCGLANQSVGSPAIGAILNRLI